MQKIGVIALMLMFRFVVTGESAERLWTQIQPQADRVGFTGIATSEQGWIAIGTADPMDLATYPGLYFSKEGKDWIRGNTSGDVWWRGVAGSGEGYVAVGDSGAIAFSKYGYVWETVDSGTTVHLRSVAWTGSSYIACGAGGMILRSADGTSWHSLEVNPTADYQNVFVSSGKVHAVGGSLLVTSVDDGLKWTTHDLGPQAVLKRGCSDSGGVLLYSNNGSVRQLYRENGAGGWNTLAVPGQRPLVGLGFCEGKGFLALNDHGALLLSSDGVTWSTSGEALSSSGGLSPQGGLVEADDGWIVAGYQGEILRVGPGRGWSVPVSLQAGANSVAWHAGKYYAFGHYGSIYSSIDGLSWSTAYGSSSADVLRSSVLFDGQLIVVGARGAVRRIDATGGVNYGYVGSLADLRGVASSGTRLVAVGMAGAIYRSDDGQSWSAVASPVSTDFHAIAYGDGMFHAVGESGTIMESLDGVNWEAGAVGTDATLYGVATTGAGLVVVGSGGDIRRKSSGGEWLREESGSLSDLHVVFESTDGIHACGDAGAFLSRTGDGVWTSEPTGYSRGCDFRAAVVKDGRVMLVGSSGFFEESVASSASTGWAVAESPGGGIEVLRRPYSGLEAVVEVPDGFLAAGWNGRTLLSADGEHWSEGSFPGKWTIRDLAVGDGLILAGGDQGIMVSQDGRTWGPVAYEKFKLGSATYVSPAKRVTRIVHGTSDWLAVGYSNTVLRSEDGLLWHRPADPGKAINGSTLTGAAHGAGVWVISGESGRVWTSDDGEEWVVVQTPTTKKILDVCFFQGRFLASISDAPDVMLESTDGMTWVMNPGISGWRAGELRLADGRCFGLGPRERIASSADGSSWRSHSEGTKFSNDSDSNRPEVRGLAFKNGIYVAVGTRGMIARSENSDSWRQIQGGDLRGLRRVSWLRDRFVALADPGALLTSTDCRTWTAHRAGDYPNEQLVAVADSGIRAVAVGKTVLVSDDLDSWLETGCPAGKEFTSVAWDGTRFIAGSKDGAVYQSVDGADWVAELG